MNQHQKETCTKLNEIMEGIVILGSRATNLEEKVSDVSILELSLTPFVETFDAGECDLLSLNDPMAYSD